ncbi:MAG: ImmA/IrrE family metallo-endopeptidase, partial [Xanthomonadales bacterium]|nr:ImmA/IrrE family metallo-endopeptidase [Xanthomonadales bacterium]
MDEILTSEEFLAPYPMSIGVYDGKRQYSLVSIVKSLIDAMPNVSRERADQEFKSNSRHSSARVRYVPDLRLENISQRLLAAIEYRDGVVSIEDICDFLEVKCALKVRFESLRGINVPPTVLGAIDFRSRVIRIYGVPSDVTLPQTRFTIAHEVAHFVLRHDRYLHSEVFEASDADVGADVNSGLASAVARMEWQANFVAASLLLPKTMVVQAFRRQIESAGVRDRGHGPL